MTSNTFNSLLHRIQQGDMSALQPIYCAYYKSMCNQALWMVHNKSDAQDVASDALLKLVKYAQKSDRAEVKDGVLHITSSETVGDDDGTIDTSVYYCKLDAFIWKRYSKGNIPKNCLRAGTTAASST